MYQEAPLSNNQKFDKLLPQTFDCNTWDQRISYCEIWDESLICDLYNELHSCFSQTDEAGSELVQNPILDLQGNVHWHCISEEQFC